MGERFFAKSAAGQMAIVRFIAFSYARPLSVSVQFKTIVMKEVN
jgi:hypothetical protein